MRTGGTSSSEVNPKRYSLVLFAADMVLATSNEIQSISSSVSTIALGVIIEVINALLSLSNASFLNPEETRESCPKLEFELVILRSPPLSESKCLLNPIAKTDTI